MTVEISLGLWQDRPAHEVVETARLVDDLGFAGLWIGEMATYDAFALGAALGPGPVPLVLGPFAVTVRDPMMIAMGAASVADLTGRPVSVALGTSSPLVVEQWHGRSRARSARALEDSARAVRPLLDGAKAEVAGEVVRTNGYRLRLPAPRSPLVIAAAGPRAIRAAVAHADRLVLNLVDPPTAGTLVAQAREAARVLGRPVPRVAVWAPAAIAPAGPHRDAVDQLRRGVVGYLAAPGYADMFERAGFGEVVAFARTRPHPRDLLDAIPAELVAAIGVLGDADTAASRIAAYADHGVDDVVLVPSATDADPAGETTLRSVAKLGA